jgi:hypothetical protein
VALVGHHPCDSNGYVQLYACTCRRIFFVIL